MMQVNSAGTMPMVMAMPNVGQLAVHFFPQITLDDCPIGEGIDVLMMP